MSNTAAEEEEEKVLLICYTQVMLASLYPTFLAVKSDRLRALLWWSEGLVASSFRSVL